MRLFGLKRQNGNSDVGVLLLIAGAAVVIGIATLVLGWVKDVNDSRHTHHVKDDNKPITDPYHEPGAFQVTF